MKVTLILRYLLVPVVGLILFVCFVVAAGWLASKVFPSNISEEWLTAVIVGECLIGIFLSAWASWGLLIGFGPSKKEMEAYSRRFTQRLRTPQITALERGFRHPLPQALLDLYQDQTEVQRSDFEVAPTEEPDLPRWQIAFYQPADEESVRDNWPVLERYFAFASDGQEGGYLVDPAEEDPVVYFLDDDTGELQQVCPRLSEFMRWPRLSRSE